MKKHFAVWLILLITAVSSLACAAPAGPQTDNARETVAQGLKKLYDMESGHLDMVLLAEVTFEGRPTHLVVNVSGDVQANPLLGKLAINLAASAGKKYNLQLQQYFGEEGDQLVVYSGYEGKWERQAMPKILCAVPNKPDHLLKAINNVTKIREDDAATVFEVVANGQKLFDAAEYSSTERKLFDKIFGRDMPEVKYFITIDKSTGEITRMDIEITDIAVVVINKFAEGSKRTEKQDEMLKEVLSSLKVYMRIDIGARGVEDIIIPQEIKDAAKVNPRSKPAGL